MKLYQANHNFRISIPTDICVANGWIGGTELLVTMPYKGIVQITEMKKVKIPKAL